MVGGVVREREREWGGGGWLMVGRLGWARNFLRTTHLHCLRTRHSTLALSIYLSIYLSISTWPLLLAACLAAAAVRGE